MATSLPIRDSQAITLGPSTVRVLHLWHLLSLDAPTVAVVWTAAVARATHSPLSLTTLAAMFFAVWIIYAADRLLDTHTELSSLEARHEFHRAHRRTFLKAILLASVALILLVPNLPAAQLRLGLVLAAALALWMLAIHTQRRPLPKEFLVGLFFAAATFIPSASAPHIALPAALFAALCTLNCLYIRAWEQNRPSPAIATMVLILLAAATTPLRPVTASIALAATLLLVVQQARHRSAPTTARALADLALLTPLLLAFWRK